jgi:glycosyltransferase involved in cell wall biosynthesis
MTAVSAVIPVYNGARYIAEAISSVLDQKLPPVECVVVDDGSTDATADVVADFGAAVTYVRAERGGVSKARNHGIRLARGELVAFLDHDDVWLPEKLERQVEALCAQPDANLGLCAVEMMDAGGRTNRVMGLSQRRNLVMSMLTYDGIEIPSCSSAGLARREWLLSAGGFDNALSTCADWDLLLRSLLDGDLSYVDEPLVRYRVHDSNMSRNVGSIERDMRYAFAKAFGDPRLPASVRVQRRHAYARMYRMLAGSYRDVGDRKALVRTFARALGYEPSLVFELLGRAAAHSPAKPKRLLSVSRARGGDDRPFT